MPDTNSVKETETISERDLWLIKLMLNPQGVTASIAGIPLQVVNVTREVVQLRMIANYPMTITDSMSVELNGVCISLKGARRMPIHMGHNDTITFTLNL